MGGHVPQVVTEHSRIPSVSVSRLRHETELWPGLNGFWSLCVNMHHELVKLLWERFTLPGFIRRKSKPLGRSTCPARGRGRKRGRGRGCGVAQGKPGEASSGLTQAPVPVGLEAPTLFLWVWGQQPAVPLFPDSGQGHRTLEKPLAHSRGQQT